MASKHAAGCPRAVFGQIRRDARAVALAQPDLDLPLVGIVDGLGEPRSGHLVCLFLVLHTLEFRRADPLVLEKVPTDLYVLGRV